MALAGRMVCDYGSGRAPNGIRAFASSVVQKLRLGKMRVVKLDAQWQVPAESSAKLLHIIKIPRRFLLLTEYLLTLISLFSRGLNLANPRGLVASNLGIFWQLP